MLVDFHTHTTASDGALSPAALIESARDAGVSALAITDHDTVRGFQSIESSTVGLRLIPGVELSCVWGGVNVHIVGLGIDPSVPALATLLTSLDEARLARAERIASRLSTAGIEGALAGALSMAGDSQVGRPHFAQWMVTAGHVADLGEAFDRWLGRGKLGDVKTFWPGLATVVEAVVAAGGVAVLAHPLKYGMTRMKLHAMTADFVAAGGTGIELISGVQSADDTAQVRRLADGFDLGLSLGSDFHREWQFGPTLGVATDTVPPGRGIWERLL